MFTYNELMTKYQAFKAIREEIDRLNREIDLKIILGRPYMLESRRHKTLLEKLEKLSPGRAWLKRSLNIIASLVL
ncbi:MAG: hypothetical protein Q8P07_01290 [bacterium]|nr:hypothetical protein [bacterium]